MGTLTQSLLDPARRPQTVETFVDVVDSEVADKSGISGAALKTAYAGAKKVSDGLVRRAIDSMLPEFAEQLSPYWDAKGDQAFGDYLVSRQDEVADSLLSVTDRRAQDPDHAAVAKVYNTIRPKAKNNVVEALPRVGTAIENLMQ